MVRKIVAAVLLYAFARSATYAQVQNISEHCFGISPQRTVAIEEVTTTPQNFVRNHANVEAAINGPISAAKIRSITKRKELLILQMVISLLMEI